MTKSVGPVFTYSAITAKLFQNMNQSRNRHEQTQGMKRSIQMVKRKTPKPRKKPMHENKLQLGKVLEVQNFTLGTRGVADAEPPAHQLPMFAYNIGMG